MVIKEENPPKLRVPEVSTVHGLIYGKPQEHGICPKCMEPSKELAVPSGERASEGHTSWTCPACRHKIPLDTPIGSMLVFAPPEAGSGPGEDTVLVIDEASMVSAEMLNDVVRFMDSAPVIMVGDPGQLPPVGEDNAPALSNATIHLHQIHRQKEGSAIIHAANLARSGMGKSILSLRSGNGLVVKSYCKLHEVIGWAVAKLNAEQDCAVVCYTNNMREYLNSEIRAPRVRTLLAKMERDGVAQVSQAVLPGERLVCLANNRPQGVMNGEILEVLDVQATDEPALVQITVSREGENRTFLVCPSAFGREFREFAYDIKKFDAKYHRAVDTWRKSSELIKQFPKLTDYLKAMNVMDASKILHVSYGYALTVHKSQGSQWDHVAYVWESATWGMAYKEPDALAKHLYTGITRAVKEVTVFSLAKGENAPRREVAAVRKSGRKPWDKSSEGSSSIQFDTSRPVINDEDYGLGFLDDTPFE
jgi:exodeoxyribonuclease-5